MSEAVDMAPGPRNLSRLFRPRSIAVIGGGWGLAVVEQCLKMGFEGPIWPVHPKREEMHGIPCIPSIEDLPEPPDATFIGVNRHLTVEAVAALSRMGAGGAVCFASGFAEAEDGREAGADLQARLVAAAGDMPIVGPNCYGMINYLDGALLWPDQHGGRREEKGVALLTQSGNMLINLTMQARGLPLAYCIAAGNQAQTGLAEMAMACLDDERVSAVGLHIEGVGDVRAFEALAARARALRKPVVAVKVGRSAEAQAAMVSHTASLSGGDAAARAFLKRLAIPCLDSLPEFLETLKLLHVLGPMPGREIASISCSGGEAGLMADAVVGRRLRYRPMTVAEKAPVTEVLGPLVTVANPLDYHTFIWGDEARMTAAFTAMLQAGFDASVFVLDFPRLDRCTDASWHAAVEGIKGAQRATGARVVVTASLGENMPEARVAEFAASGIAGLHGVTETMAALEAAADVAVVWDGPAPAPVLLGGGAGTRTLDEAAAKALLAKYGVTVPRGVGGATPEELGAASAALAFPVAVKALGLAHKTEAGAVKLGLGDAAAVRDAASAMPAGSGFLAEEMVAGAVAELIVGVVRDPVYGFAMTLGAGGVLTEMLADSATLLLPATEREVRAALDGLRVAPLLRGYRGKPGADMDALVAAIMAVQDCVTAEADRLAELEINPLMATPAGAVAVDALIRMED